MSFSSLPYQLEEARQALVRLAPLLPPETQQTLNHRVATWDAQLRSQNAPQPGLPELVMRPGLPPRPLNKHYFTVVRTYD